MENSESIQITNNMDIKIVEVKTPSEIIIRPTEKENEYQSMLHDLSFTYSKMTNKSTEIEVGTNVAAKIKGHIWLRGVVLQNTHNTTVMVYLYETGENKTLAVENVLPLHQKFQNLPPLAVCIHLNVVSQLMCL